MPSFSSSEYHLEYKYITSIVIGILSELFMQELPGIHIKNVFR